MGVGMGVKRLKSQSSELIPKKTPYPRARRLLLSQVWGFEVPRIPPRLLQTGRIFHSPSTDRTQIPLAFSTYANLTSYHLPSEGSSRSPPRADTVLASARSDRRALSAPEMFRMDCISQKPPGSHQPRALGALPVAESLRVK